MSILAIIKDIDRDRALLERARSLAIGEEDDMLVLSLATSEEYESVADTLNTIGEIEHTSYDEDAVREGLVGDVSDLASSVLGTAVPYDVRVCVTDGDQAERIITVAEDTGCDHVFLPGRRRSPTGKAVFGDRTQQVILDFEGYVTVAME